MRNIARPASINKRARNSSSTPENACRTTLFIK